MIIRETSRRPVATGPQNGPIPHIVLAQFLGLRRDTQRCDGSLTAGRANLVTATHDVAGQDLDPVTSAQTQRQDVGQRRQCVARAVVVRWVEVVVVGGGSTPPATVRV